MIRSPESFWEREFVSMSFALIAKIVAPLLAGGVLGSVALVGLVYSQSQAPASNPADQQILVYGDR